MGERGEGRCKGEGEEGRCKEEDEEVKEGRGKVRER